MKFLLMFVFFAQLTILSGQNTFQVLFSGPNTNDAGSKIIEDNDGNFLVVGSFVRIESPTRQGMIWKISSAGDTISKIIGDNDSVIQLFYIKQLENNNYKIIGSIGATASSINKLLVLELNTSLDIISRKEFELPGFQTISFSYMKKHLNSYYIFFGITGTGANPPNLRDPYFVKLNSNFDTILTRSFSIYGDQTCHEMLFSPDGSQMWLLSDSYFPELITSCRLQLVVYDTLFNYQRVKTLTRTDMMGLAKAKWLTDSTFILAYNHVTFPLQEEIAFTETDSTFLFNNNTLIGVSDTIDYIGFGTTVDFISADNIHYVGTKNIISSYWPQQPSWIRVGMLNRQLEPVYERFYGGDAHYRAFSVLSTSDGGAFIAATRYDHNQHNNFNDMFYLKVNDQGLVTNTNRPHICQMVPAIIYPNPAKDMININLSWDKASCFITDITGKQVLQSELINGINRIDTGLLFPGYYLLVIRGGDNQTFTNKMIICR